jgi:hypothetical protein
MALGSVFQFRAFCCDIASDGIMGVSKDPVPLLTLNPNPACVGDTITWDLTESYAPGSAITAWEIDFDNDGEGVWYINWGIGQAGSGSGSGTGGGGGSGSGSGSAGSGTGSGNVIPMWVAKNTGLTGTALNVRHLTMKPGSEVRAPETHELWAATEGGVYKTTNGGESWAKIELPDPSNDEFQDVTPVTVGQLDYRWISFSTSDPNTVYVLTSKS